MVNASEDSSGELRCIWARCTFVQRSRVNERAVASVDGMARWENEGCGALQSTAVGETVILLHALLT